eukprot:5885274-Amphidinium_carterae.1
MHQLVQGTCTAPIFSQTAVKSWRSSTSLTWAHCVVAAVCCCCCYTDVQRAPNGSIQAGAAEMEWHTNELLRNRVIEVL